MQMPSGDIHVRLTLHGPHRVLRRVSRALNVRIWPAQDELGPYVVVDEVKAPDLAAIFHILSGETATTSSGERRVDLRCERHE